MKALIIIPAYNEESAVSLVINEVQALRHGYDIVVVNDGSTDRTLQEATRGGTNVLSHPINLGIGATMQTGFRYAMQHGYDCAVQVDGDGQHPSAEIPRLLEALERGKADVVIGSRFLEGRGFQSTFTRRIGIKYFQMLHRLLTGVRITDSTSGFRALNRKTLELVERYYPDEYPEAESIVLYALNGLRMHEVPVSMRERQGGVSSIGRLAGVYYMFKVTLAIIFTHLRLRKGHR